MVELSSPFPGASVVNFRQNSSIFLCGGFCRWSLCPFERYTGTSATILLPAGPSSEPDHGDEYGMFYRPDVGALPYLCSRVSNESHKAGCDNCAR